MDKELARTVWNQIRLVSDKEDVKRMVIGDVRDYAELTLEKDCGIYPSVLAVSLNSEFYINIQDSVAETWVTVGDAIVTVEKIIQRRQQVN